MRSIIYAIECFFLIPVVDVSSCSNYYHIGTWCKDQVLLNCNPIKFGYCWNDILRMDIKLMNISPSVTSGHLIYQSGVVSEWKTLNIDRGESVFQIHETLKQHQIFFDVELQTEKGLCTKKRIAEGKYWSTRDYEYHCYDLCCVIEVDFQQKCEEPKTPTHYCYKYASQYICTLYAKPQDTIYQWRQTYDNNSFIGSTPKTQATKTSIYINLEQFDNNTSVLYETSSQQGKMIWAGDINLTAKDIIKDYNVTTLRYSETTDVQFNCQEYLNLTKYIQVGIINTTENKIVTYEPTEMPHKYNMSDNGTVLCCLYYVMHDVNVNLQKHIIRIVANRTLLVHDKGQSITTNVTANIGQKSSLSQNTVIYVLVSVVGMCVLLTVTSIVFIKLCHKNVHAVETVELNTHDTPEQVLYASLDFGNSENQTRSQTEESPYAVIVGVLKPFN